MRRPRLAWALAVLAAGGCAAIPPAPLAAPGLRFERGAVAADHPLASEAGAEMLRLGGNAVDAAVAASFCLSVVRPDSCGIGGGGFMVICGPGRDGEPLRVALDYRETAPAACGPDHFGRLADPEASRRGPHAAGVPGTVAGLLLALERYGTLDRRTVMAPAIRAAADGFRADAYHVEAAADLAERLRTAPPDVARSASYIWETLCRAGHVKEGDLVRNPRQAEALRNIAAGGVPAFYGGPVAGSIVSAMRAGGGPMTRDDLAGYRVRVLAPLVGTFRGLELVCMPPPSSGGVALLQILGILERRLGRTGPDGPHDPAYLHLLVEAMKHAFADRAAWLADPEYAEVPVPMLLSPAHLDRIAASIDEGRTREPMEYGPAELAPQDSGTSHLSVVDGAGLGVACTETINLPFGSMVEVEGFALNNEMDDFTTRPGQPNAFGLVQSGRNLPEPGKRPLSSMCPTVVLDRGRVVLVAGASGGPRIIPATAQALVNCLVFGLPPRDAVAAARVHHQWVPDVVELEASWPDAATALALRERGHAVGTRETVGAVQLVQVTDSGVLAASDPRKGGRPAGH